MLSKVILQPWNYNGPTVSPNVSVLSLLNLELVWMAGNIIVNHIHYGFFLSCFLLLSQLHFDFWSFSFLLFLFSLMVFYLFSANISTSHFFFSSLFTNRNSQMRVWPTWCGMSLTLTRTTTTCERFWLKHFISMGFLLEPRRPLSNWPRSKTWGTPNDTHTQSRLVMLYTLCSEIKGILNSTIRSCWRNCCSWKIFTDAPCVIFWE